MGRTKGATNIDKLPAELEMSDEQRLSKLAGLILEIVTEET
jgi:hypothetical protein